MYDRGTRGSSPAAAEARVKKFEYPAKDRGKSDGGFSGTMVLKWRQRSILRYARDRNDYRHRYSIILDSVPMPASSCAYSSTAGQVKSKKRRYEDDDIASRLMHSLLSLSVAEFTAAKPPPLQPSSSSEPLLPSFSRLIDYYYYILFLLIEFPSPP